MQPPSILRWAIPSAIITIMFSGLLNADDRHYLITNNDLSQGNSASLYEINHDGTLRSPQVVPTRGTGVDGVGAVATKRVSLLKNSSQSCAFISDAGSVDVAGISVTNIHLTGTFKAASTDSAPSGIGVVNNGKYLYASFTGSGTLGTYQILGNCSLHFIQDIAAVGVNGAAILDMQVHGSILVASFNDGSIESFNVSGGVPISNGDLQLSTANSQYGSFAAGVDITSDGHYAIFGGTNAPPLVEVSDISSGKLSPTVVYSNIGSGGGSEAIWLSPDESLLYLSNFSSNQVTAAFFDASSGGVTFGCTGTFRGIAFEAGLATATQEGTGGTVYVIEPDTGIGYADVAKNSGTCSITEDSRSPDTNAFSSTVESAASFPPRSF